jgi:hypothetical protein
MAKKETSKKTAIKKGKPGREPKAKVEKTVIEEAISEKNEPVEETTIEVVFEEAAPIEKEENEEHADVEVTNNDPVVAAPVEEKKEEVLRETTSLVPEKIETEMQPEEYEAAEPAKKKPENKPKENVIRKLLGYFWNGQEMDY